MNVAVQLPPATDTKPLCPVCGATTGLRRLNDIAPDLETPSTAPDYYACANADDCINRALKAAADLITPGNTEPDSEPDADTEPDTDEPSD